MIWLDLRGFARHLLRCCSKGFLILDVHLLARIIAIGIVCSCCTLHKFVLDMLLDLLRFSLRYSTTVKRIMLMNSTGFYFVLFSTFHDMFTLGRTVFYVFFSQLLPFVIPLCFLSTVTRRDERILPTFPTWCVWEFIHNILARFETICTICLGMKFKGFSFKWFDWMLIWKDSIMNCLKQQWKYWHKILYLTALTYIFWCQLIIKCSATYSK